MFRGHGRDQGVADERHAGALAHRKWTNEPDKLAMQYQNGAAPAETPDVGEWRDLVQQAGMADAGLVGTLPRVSSGLRASRDVETP